MNNTSILCKIYFINKMYYEFRELRVIKTLAVNLLGIKITIEISRDIDIHNQDERGYRGRSLRVSHSTSTPDHIYSYQSQ